VEPDWESPAAAMPPGIIEALGEAPAPTIPRLPLTVATTSRHAAKNAPMIAIAE
jgi:hypothetical protein